MRVFLIVVGLVIAFKDDVTTPGGCAIAGLMVLEDGPARSLLARAIETTTTVAAGPGQ